jgi:hypothetical protein
LVGKSPLTPLFQRGEVIQREDRLCSAATLALAFTLLATAAAAQIRTPGRGAVSENEGPIGEGSLTIGEVSKPVGDGLTIGESSGGPIRSGPVSDMNTRSMLSGPVSSMSRGPVSSGKPMTGGPSITEASAGAVKHDIDMPLGERISAPLRELAPLQEQLKRLRIEGDAAAIEAAAAPVSLPVEDEPPIESLDEVTADEPLNDLPVEGHAPGEATAIDVPADVAAPLEAEAVAVPADEAAPVEVDLTDVEVSEPVEIEAAPPEHEQPAEAPPPEPEPAP